MNTNTKLSPQSQKKWPIRLGLTTTLILFALANIYLAFALTDSTITALLLLVAFAGACASLIFCVAMLLLFWVAKGESDVNGDPERDAGLLPERGSATRSNYKVEPKLTAHRNHF